jgi:plastocyanin
MGQDAEDGKCIQFILSRYVYVTVLVLGVGLVTACDESAGAGVPSGIAPTVAVPTSAPVVARAPAVASPMASPGLVSMNDRGERSVDGLGMVEIEASDFAFTPTTLRGTPGQHLKMAIENAATIDHNFSLDEQGVQQDITPGGRATVEVTFPTSGSLRFFCALHAGQGMNGQLVSGATAP